MENTNIEQTSFYPQGSQTCAFRKSREQWGEFSNMTHNFPVQINGVRFQSSEGLYQALKFGDSPQFQLKIAQAHNGYAAKKVAYGTGKPAMRPDWDDVRIDAMRVAVGLKAASWQGFIQTLLSTGDRPIVENSRRDTFWGAYPLTNGYQGSNVLGKVLMELRETLRNAPCDHMTPETAMKEAAKEFAAAAAGHHGFKINGRILLTDTNATGSADDFVDRPF